MANVTSISTGAALGASRVSMDSNRRLFNFGDRVAELAPQQSPFFVYLSKVAKKATDDPVFKFLEQRHQWQRRNFHIATAVTANAVAAASVVTPITIDPKCYYNNDGTVSPTEVSAQGFLVKGAMVAIECSWDADGAGAGAAKDGIMNAKVTTAGTVVTPVSFYSNDGTTFETFDDTDTTETLAIADNAKGQIIGSSYEEASTSPDGWQDSLADKEGYCQIFKTGMNIFSGTAMATRYRGIADEYKRVWQEKLMEHKMDLEQAFLFGMGSAGSKTATADTTTRYTHGILPYTRQYGKVYNFSYSSSGYDAFLDAMEDFFAVESGNSGNKLVLASRKVITYLNKLGAGSFMNNSVGSSQYSLDINSIPGAFGHQVTMVNTIFGNLHFVAEPLLRGPWEDYCVCVDMKNVAYRPLSGNGISRDTFIETNVQANDMDGRKDQIITEAGLEISLPETHAILKFS